MEEKDWLDQITRRILGVLCVLGGEK